MFSPKVIDKVQRNGRWPFFFFFFFFFGDTITVTNFSGKNLVPPQIGLRSYAQACLAYRSWAKIFWFASFWYKMPRIALLFQLIDSNVYVEWQNITQLKRNEICLMRKTLSFLIRFQKRSSRTYFFPNRVRPGIFYAEMTWLLRA